MNVERLIKKLGGTQAFCIDLLRIYIGIGLFLKGTQFIIQESTLSHWLSEAGQLLIIPSFLVHYIVIAHLCGGILLAAGLLTRFAAMIQIPIILGAILTIHLKEGIFQVSQNLEFTILLFFILALLSLCGSGKLSADHYMELEYKQKK
jgi:uncharacterized membrane protein YphA (DoxX/SURF4 family)